MKQILAISTIAISIFTVSCHRKQLVTSRISCCPQAASSDPVKIAPLDGQASIYQLPGVWTDQHNRNMHLEQLKGKVQVMAMIFTHCAYACPRIVQDMKAIEDSLTGPGKNNVGFVLVSFDSQRDDPAQLRRFASEQGLDDCWTLLHGDARQVRELSMLLNVKYQDAGDNNFAHSNAILILDKEGSVTRSLEGLQPQTALAGEVINQLANR